jgi:hypothetical protein
LAPCRRNGVRAADRPVSPANGLEAYAETQRGMNIGRGLFRFWLIGTALWVIYWSYRYATNCSFTTELVVCGFDSILVNHHWSAGGGG